MEANKALYEYLKEQTRHLTEEWYTSLDGKETAGVYTTEDPEAVQTLKDQNHAFHERFITVYLGCNEQFRRNFENWVIQIANDEGHLETPSHYITQEFFSVQDQYLDLIQQFADSRTEPVPQQRIDYWKRETIRAFGEVISWFLKEQDIRAKAIQREQQHVINRLSSPIITLNKNVALLPLIGNIDEERAAFMLENTLEECSKREIRHLLIDMSGVARVDGIVAHQIFQLIEALCLIGVQSTLSGIRPEIAQTAVQFRERFDRTHIVPALATAIDQYL